MWRLEVPWIVFLYLLISPICFLMLRWSIWGETYSFCRRYINWAFSMSILSASFFLLMKLRLRFCLTGLELSTIVAVDKVVCKSDWLLSISLMFMAPLKWLLARYWNTLPPLTDLPWDSKKASWLNYLLDKPTSIWLYGPSSCDMIESLCRSLLYWLTVLPNIFILLRPSASESNGLSDEGLFISCL